MACKYADSLHHLLPLCPFAQVADLRLSSPEAQQAQHAVCAASEQLRRLADLQLEQRMRERKRGVQRLAAFSWIERAEVVLSSVTEGASAGAFYFQFALPV